MELREKIAAMLWSAPLNPSDRDCHGIADAILAIPEIREALGAKPLCACGSEAEIIQCSHCNHYANMDD